MKNPEKLIFIYNYQYLYFFKEKDTNYYFVIIKTFAIVTYVLFL